MSKTVRGTFYTLVAGTAWGLSGTSGQYLMAHGFSALSLTNVRLLIETNFTNFSICLGTLVVALLFGGLLRAILLILYIVLMFLLPFYSARIAE